MWQKLKSMFAGLEKQSESKLIHEKLGKRHVREVEEPEDYTVLLHIEDTHPDTHSMSDRDMVTFWRERSEAKISVRLGACEEHVRYSLNTSETLMQPGCAERFSLVRENPWDESNARRKRTTQTNLPAQFLRKSAKFQRIA